MEFKFGWNLDWCSWLFGAQVDSDLHWTQNRRVTYVTVHIGPLELEWDIWGREK